MSFSAAALARVLEDELPPGATGLVVALSGGADSGCLAAAVAALARDGGLPPVRAVHVDHGLQAAAAEFRAVCERLCSAISLPLTIVKPPPIAAGPGVSLEAAARDARYAVLARDLRAGECLLTAHHAEDQAETLLLQALRGSGLAGLASMPRRRRLGPGWHLRPLLAWSRADLERCAAAFDVATMCDPMNEDLRFDRVYLRRRVWPRLAARWPGAAATLTRTAQHAAEAQDLLNEVAADDLGCLRDGDGLSIPHLRRLAPARRVNAVRAWIAAQGPPPPTARLTEALRQILHARSDQSPAVVWGMHALRRYRERLFVTAATPVRLSAELSWDPRAQPTLELGCGLGRLRAAPGPGGFASNRLPALLTVRGRRGGESLKPAPAAATQTVRHLCQADGVLPWMRGALPFLYAGTALIGVGDLWMDSAWCVDSRESGLRVSWEEAPSLV